MPDEPIELTPVEDSISFSDASELEYLEKYWDSADSLSLSDTSEWEYLEKYWNSSDTFSLSDAIAHGFLLFQFAKADTLASKDVGKKLMYPMKKEVFTKSINLKLEL